MADNAPSRPSDLFSAVGTGLLTRLRISTSHLYEAFEKGVLADASVLTRENYVTHLQRFHDAASSILARIRWAQLAELGLDRVDARRDRFAEIERDLESLGADMPEGEIFTCPSRKGDVTAAESVGYAFVLEGSVYIGRDMAAAFLRAPCGIEPSNTRFLRAYGVQSYDFWQSLIRWIDSIEADEAFITEACAAAVCAFQILSESLTPSVQRP